MRVGIRLPMVAEENPCEPSSPAPQRSLRERYTLPAPVAASDSDCATREVHNLSWRAHPTVRRGHFGTAGRAAARFAPTPDNAPAGPARSAGPSSSRARTVEAASYRAAHKAALTGSCHTLHRLQLRNEDLFARSQLGYTPLHLAAQYGHAAVVAFLRESPDMTTEHLNAAQHEGATALYLAAQNGHANVVTQLLQRPDIDRVKPQHDGWAPLLIAVQRDHEGVVKLLGHDHPMSPDGHTALGIARAHRRKHLIKHLNPRGCWLLHPFARIFGK